MSDWNPALYMKFGSERTQPAIDLVNRIQHPHPKRILDIGCGPGNSTILLARRWPKAEIIGLDSSAEMIARAQADYPQLQWVHKDAGGELQTLGQFDIVFSNAALQWIPNHAHLLPNIFALLNRHGILAVQVPNNNDAPLHIAVRATAASPRWRDQIRLESSQVYDPPETYYDQIATLTDQIDLWQTIYYHIMGSHQDLIDWSRGTYMRPFLNALPTEELQEVFAADVLQAIKPAYIPQENGHILFPFQRIFFTAGRKDSNE